MHNPEMLSKLFIEVALRHLTTRPMGLLSGTESGKLQLSPHWLEEVVAITKGILAGTQEFVAQETATKEQHETTTKITKAAHHLLKQFKKTTQKASYSKKEKQAASRAFVSGVCALAEASSDDLTREEWDSVFSILADKLTDFEF